MKNKTECMDIRSFAEMVSRAVSEELGGECQVKLQEVMKNNGIILQGLVILTGQKNLSPTIYLNSFLDEYQAGIPLMRIVSEILEIYHRDMPKKNINMDFFRDFDKVSPGICYRVINRERNRVLLEHIPHVDFLDLSICFFYAFQNAELGSGSILIYNSHTDLWNCKTEMLMRLAQKNTRRIYPWELRNMRELIAELLERESLQLPGDVPDRRDTPMRVLSNQRRIYGATCMIYPGVLCEAAASVQENLYVLPSSVHEVILVPESAVDDVQFVKDMVREVNATQVQPEEILSSNLYFYDYQKDHVMIL